MEVLCGIEVDETIPEDYPLREFDYKIGSSHAVKSTDGNYYMVDHSPKVFIEGIEKGLEYILQNKNLLGYYKKKLQANILDEYRYKAS